MKRKIAAAAALAAILIGSFALLYEAETEGTQISRTLSSLESQPADEAPEIVNSSFNTSDTYEPAAHRLDYGQNNSWKQGGQPEQTEQEQGQQQSQEDAATNTNTTATTATFAGIARTTTNHIGANFEDMAVTANYPAFELVTLDDMRQLLIDKGMNDTAYEPGPEDIPIREVSIEKRNGNQELYIDPVNTPSYRLQEDDRVIVEFTSFQTPSEPGENIIGFEIISRDTNQTYEPVEVTLEYQEE